MSAILGLFNQNGAPVDLEGLCNMASLLTPRGPDNTGLWRSGAVGMGHTLRATTPESRFETLPLEHAGSGCVITADVRLDNREALLGRLDLSDRAQIVGDAEIIVSAYLAWGDGCVEHLLGDFAFAIWDPRYHRLLCARDQFGMRSLYYHHSPGRFFAFATEPRAILVLPQTPYQINDARIADHLVEDLEAIDKTSTFFQGVFRLPPASLVSVTPGGLVHRRYWKLEAQPELRLNSDQEYAEAFLDVFSDAVSCRLRTVGPPGSMLSGGMDSGAIVAVARRSLRMEERGPLWTVSAVSPDVNTDPETQAIQSAMSMGGLSPSTVSYGDGFEELLPELEHLVRTAEEPFDGFMTIIYSVYLRAREEGLSSLLDGASGDVVLTEGRHLARLLRAGRWRTAYQEAVGRNRFWKGAYPPGRELLRSARAAFVPDFALRPVRRVRLRADVGRTIANALISDDFARRALVQERYQTYEGHRAGRRLGDGRSERALELDQPYVATGRERYDRVAASVGIEPRDPFLDRRVVAFCTGLPASQISRNGWPKALLRTATEGELPDSVRWRRGKEHLGWAFTTALMDRTREAMRGEIEAASSSLSSYIDASSAAIACRSYFDERDDTHAEQVYNLVCLSRWLIRHSERPRPSGHNLRHASAGRGG